MLSEGGAASSCDDSDESTVAEDGDEPGDAGAGPGVSGAASSSSGYVVTIDNCLNVYHANRDAVFEALPLFTVTPQWDVQELGSAGSPLRTLGRIRCIQGSSLRVDCRRHSFNGVKCKCHIDIHDNFWTLDAFLVKWLIHGLTIPEGSEGADEHMHIGKNKAREASL